MAFQKFVPIMELETRRVLGLLDLGSNIEFTGAEASYILPSGITIPLVKHVPEASTIRKGNPWFMAAPFSRSDVRAGLHKGFPEFIPLEDVSPSQTFTVSSGIGYQQRNYNGPVIDGIEGNFAAGRDQHPPAA